MVVITVDTKTVALMQQTYQQYIIPNEGEYVDFCAKHLGVVITAYKSKKANKKVTFQGNGELEEARLWDPSATVTVAKSKVQTNWVCFEDQIGSDEVGVGDFLLPMIVVAAFVRGKDMKTLKEFGVDDSKKLKDAEILKMGPELVKKFFFSKLTLPNEKYNEMIEKGENLNSLKAKMHNRALLNMVKQYPDVKNIFVDEFAKEETYYKYLNDKNEVKVGDITFRTKGESYYPCVALASVIARYAFLLEKETLSKKYKMEFPFGASGKVDEFAKKFIAKYGIEEFNKIAKKNFKNYSEAIKK